MKKSVEKLSRQKLAAAVAAVAISASGAAFADGAAAESTTLADAITGGDVKLSFRYRYENVDDDARPEEAGASTLKSRLTYTTKVYKAWQAQVEVDDVTVIGGENYDDLHNTKTDHAVVADPEGTAINQAWIAYKGLDNTTLKYGRQRINLDNQRFVGGVGWRQNEQTYDGFSVTNTSLADTTITYAHIDNVNRIFGPDEGRGPAADVKLESNINVLNVGYKGLGIGTLTGYAYLLDIEDAPGASSKTYGVRLSGSTGDETKFLYTAEYAAQSDYGDNTANYDADYYSLEVGVEAGGITAKLGQEVLEGDDEGSFSTPLATLHKFQGFADKFLVTPRDGVEDLYASVFGKVLGAKVGIIYHDFEANEGSADYGDEIDLVIAKQLHKNVHLLLKYASYDADEHSTDTDKLWAQLTVSF